MAEEDGGDGGSSRDENSDVREISARSQRELRQRAVTFHMEEMREAFQITDLTADQEVQTSPDVAFDVVAAIERAGYRLVPADEQLTPAEAEAVLLDLAPPNPGTEGTPAYRSALAKLRASSLSGEETRET